ncbi:MAG TPA: hypothetical protein VFF06_20420 [Polyangia bacterium]|nr:hypothetical protein [Polyangia bacterium]
MKARLLFAAGVLALTMFGFGAPGTAHTATLRIAPTVAESRAAQSLPNEHRPQAMACRPKGAACKVMNGKNPEGDNNLCCSQHCNWDNSAQNYLCD